MANYYFTIPDSITLPADGNKVSLTTACELHRDDSAVPNALTVAAGGFNVFLADSPGTGTATAPDVTAPTLSSPTGAKNGETGATSLGVTTDEGNGTLYWGIYPTASTPSAADVVAGTGATVSGSQAVSATGVQSVADQTGLTDATAYKAHYVQDDAASNRSTVATSSEFTTDAAGSGFTDTFSQANGTRLDTLSDYVSTFQQGADFVEVQSGQAVMDSGSGDAQWLSYDGASLANDQYAEVEIGTPIAATSILGRIYVRGAGLNNYYRMVINKGSIRLGKNGSGGFSEWSTVSSSSFPGGTDIVAGDKVRLEVQGTTLRAYVRGTLVDTQTDSDNASGAAGMYMAGSQKFSEFSCGDL